MSQIFFKRKVPLGLTLIGFFVYFSGLAIMLFLIGFGFFMTYKSIILNSPVTETLFYFATSLMFLWFFIRTLSRSIRRYRFRKFLFGRRD